jgi:hypothetical protein
MMSQVEDRINHIKRLRVKAASLDARIENIQATADDYHTMISHLIDALYGDEEFLCDCGEALVRELSDDDHHRLFTCVCGYSISVDEQTLTVR